MRAKYVTAELRLLQQSKRNLLALYNSEEVLRRAVTAVSYIIMVSGRNIIYRRVANEAILQDFIKGAISEYQKSQGQGGHQQGQGNQYGQTNPGNNQFGENPNDPGITGGSRFNSNQGGMKISQAGADLNGDGIIDAADQDSGNAATRDLFSNAMSFLKSGKADDDDDDVDEDNVTRAHEKAYNQGAGSNMSAQSMGAAAAMQALKRFTGGGQQAPQSTSGQGSLISMAMSEAAKLFSQSGGASNGGQQDV